MLVFSYYFVEICHLFWIWVFCQMSTLHIYIFSHSVVCLFILLIMSLNIPKLLIVPSFSLRKMLFLCVIFRKSYTTLRVYVAYYFLGLLLCHLSCVYMYPIGIDVLIWYEEGLRLIYFQSTGYPVELTLNIEKIPFVFTSCSSAMISWSDSHLPSQSTHTHADTMSV